MIELKKMKERTEQEYEKIQQERDELYEKFEDAVRSVQDRVEFRNKLLEEKLDAIAADHEQKSAQLRQVLRAADLDPSVLDMVNERLDSILDERNRMLKDLHYQVSLPTEKTEAHTVGTIFLAFYCFGYNRLLE